MNYKVNGITLFGVNYRESDKILTLFTLEKGKIGAAARGVRKANAKMKQIAEPFCFSEAVISEKSGRRTITEINSFDSFYPVRTDINKYYAGNCALEFTNAFLPEGLVSEGFGLRSAKSRRPSREVFFRRGERERLRAQSVLLRQVRRTDKKQSVSLLPRGYLRVRKLPQRGRRRLFGGYL